MQVDVLGDLVQVRVAGALEVDPDELAAVQRSLGSGLFAIGTAIVPTDGDRTIEPPTPVLDLNDR